MTASRALLAICLTALVCVSAPVAARVAAQSGIVLIEQPPPAYIFGETLTFQVTVAGPSPITTATVFYRPSDDAQTVSAAVEFTPADSVTVTSTIDLTKHLLHPFASIEYWWEIGDGAGAQLTTEAQTFYYEDNRFEWRTLSDAPVTLHWYEGDRSFAQTALDVAVAALTRANQDIGAPLPDTVHVYLYRDEQDLRATLKSLGRTWVGGHADPELGVVMMPVAPGAAAPATLERLIPHELTHLLIFRAVGGPAAYARVPTWLNEGMAVAQEARPNPDYAMALTQARDAGTLIDLSVLCGPFPSDASEAKLAYAESEAVVRYVRDIRGPQALNAMLAAYADGADCGAGVQRALGIPLAQLESDWRRDALHLTPAAFSLRSLLPWVGLALLALLLPALVAIFAFARRRPTSGSTTPT
jgi:hypothetical protein